MRENKFYVHQALSWGRSLARWACHM